MPALASRLLPAKDYNVQSGTESITIPFIGDDMAVQDRKPEKGQINWAR